MYSRLASFWGTKVLQKELTQHFSEEQALWIGRLGCVKRIFTVVASVTTIKAAGQPKTQRSTMASNSNEATNEKRAPDGKSRILFGSCNSQEYPQPLWPVIASRNATAFVWAGDAIYAGELYLTLTCINYCSTLSIHSIIMKRSSLVFAQCICRS
jgi:hypothetical protein